MTNDEILKRLEDDLGLYENEEFEYDESNSYLRLVTFINFKYEFIENKNDVLINNFTKERLTFLNLIECKLNIPLKYRFTFVFNGKQNTIHFCCSSNDYIGLVAYNILHKLLVDFFKNLGII